MSCIATFYVLPENEHDAFLSAKLRMPRTERRQVLFFKFRQSVAGEHVWEFLARVAIRKIDLEFSGFLLVDYLFVYLQIREADYFERLDENYVAISSLGAAKLADFLRARPVNRRAIEQYLKEDGRPLSDLDREGTLAAYEEAHSSLLAWCGSISGGAFGVLHLSF